MPHGMEVGLGHSRLLATLCNFLCYGDPAHPPPFKKGAQLPKFAAHMSVVAKRLDRSRCHLVRR